MRLRHDERGQAFTELILVIAFFLLVINGIVQIFLIGQTAINLQHAASRGAWLWNVWNNSNMHDRNREALQTLLPGIEEPVRVGSETDRMKGTAYQVKAHVPSVGVMRLLKPDGFTLTTRAAVIAYNPAPTAADLAQKGLTGITDWILKHIAGGD
jgi:hypothetical protein